MEISYSTKTGKPIKVFYFPKKESSEEMME